MSELEKITKEVTEEILHKFTILIQMGTWVGENSKIRDFRLNKLDYFADLTKLGKNLFSP